MESSTSLASVTVANEVGVLALFELQFDRRTVSTCREEMIDLADETNLLQSSDSIATSASHPGGD
jgi:hypothetical protein